MEIPPFVDVFPIGKGGFPASYVSLPEGPMSFYATAFLRHGAHGSNLVHLMNGKMVPDSTMS